MTNITITTETDSDWIGDIPDNWSLEKLKYIFSEKKSTSNSDLKCGSISFGKVIFKDDDKVPDSTKQSYQEVLEGEFLINPLNLNFDLKSLRIGLSKISVVVSQGYIVLKINDGYLPSYYEYLLRKFDVEHMKSLGQGVRQTISFTHIKDERLVVPPTEEQQLISRYLDKKTVQIDSLIEKIQKKIQLLKEQRTSLINQCVTKGLDPKVEMKDSGVEWIGEIPSHWYLKRLKYLVSYNQETLSENTEPDYEFNYIEIGDVNYVEGISINDKTSFSESPSRARRVVRPNDVIVSTVRTYLRSIGVVPNLDNVICSTGFCVLRDNTGLVDQRFLSYSVRSEWFVSEVISNSYGVSYPAINSSELVDIGIVIPSIDEQKKIVNFIDLNIKKIDDEIQHEERRKTLIKEYRQSLISSVVTGKVRVTEDMI